MDRPRAPTLAGLGLAAFGLLVASACSGPQAVEIPEDYGRLRTIATLYSYAIRDLGRVPQNRDDLVQMLQRVNVENPDDYLLSTRDRQPFVIIWGVDINGRFSGADVPLAYEQVGKLGKRLVINCRQEIRELSAEELRQMEFPGGHRPQL